MNPVLRGLAIYLFLLLVFRIMGKRSLAESTTFDFILLLIISEVTQQALVGEDYSLTGAFILIVTLISIDLVFSFLKDRFPMFGKITESVPLIIVDQGKPLKKRMEKCKISNEDVLEAARESFGLEKMDQIKYAIVEKDGTISIIPETKKTKP
jgi:uncharacterized membrane protein YcaP (DUF421 family)